MLSETECSAMADTAYTWNAEARNLMADGHLEAAKYYTDYLWGAYRLLCQVHEPSVRECTLRRQLLDLNLALERDLLPRMTPRLAHRA